MPRRKSQPNPPNKRIKGDSRPLSSSIDRVISLIPFNNRLLDNNEAKSELNGLAGDRRPESEKADAEENKYLHKKFKKVATLEVAPREEHFRQMTFRSPERHLDHHGLHLQENLPQKDEEDDDDDGSGGRGSAHQGQPAKHVCHYCQLVCAKPSVLEKHIRAHTNERPFPCDPCGIAFKTKSNLYKHCRSRAHTMKMDEGEQQRSRHSSSEEDEEDSEPLEAPPEHPAPPVPTSTTATNNNGKIYKPKFHKAAFYAESVEGSEDGDGVYDEDCGGGAVSASSRRHLHDPFVTSPRCDDGSAPPQLNIHSTPSTEFIHRHINKLISDNRAIVGEEPSVWTFHKRHSRHSKDESPPASAQNVHRSARQPIYQAAGEKTEHPRSSRWNQYSSDSYPPSVSIGSINNSRLSLALLGPYSGLEPLNLSTPKFETKSEMKPRPTSVSQQQVRPPSEGSIIRDILLKYKSDDRILPLDTSLLPHMHGSSSNSTVEYSSDPVCKKGQKRLRGTIQREIGLKRIKSSMAWDGPLALGPKLGKTALVDSYHKEENRYSDRTPVPADLCRSPIGTVQMFGGEVHIRDTPSGETKTLRIEPSNKRDTKPSYIEAAAELSGNRRTKPGKDPQVLTIAKTLHSVGGTVLQTQPELRSPESLGVRTFPVQVEQSPFPMAAALNPLTNITCFNPLTLPAAPALKGVYNACNVVQQQVSPRSIPHVPGIPGPNSLLSVPFVPLLKKSPSATSSVIVKASDTLDRFESPPSPLPMLVPLKMPAPDLRQDCQELATKKPRTSEDIPKTTPVKKDTNTALSTVSLAAVTTTTTTTATTTVASSCGSSSGSASPESVRDKKFVRPTSLPLRPGTYTPKRHVTLPPSQVSLVSPETPRPRKAYVQLYLNGHAYTYLGLKCSTRLFFCTLNKPQPIYLPLSPEHNKVSMYSNWKVCSESNPNPLGLNPGSAMAQYDSRNRSSSYTVSNGNKQDVITHSTYMLRKETHANKNGAEGEKNDSEKQDGGVENDTSKRIKVSEGGVDSNEDYIYVRGRGRGRYKCLECGIRCKKPSMLKKHRRTHTNSRPYNCKYCTFSFKTKGNLTKHMKSKAHFKKCKELNVSPVPTVVDESNIIDDISEDNQNNFKHSDGNNSKDESEEETEEEDELDEDEDTEDEEEGKIRLAARSLLSLSEVTPQTVKMQFVSAGLDSGRPRTYPYTLASTQKPTPSREQGLEPSSSAMLQDKDVASTGSSSAVRSRRDTSHSESDSETTKSAPDSIPAGLERSAYPNGDSLLLSGESAKPMDLSNKSTGVVHTAVITSVSGQASLLATICSTTERLPATPTADIEEESQLLQRYLKERAALESIIKQHQHQSNDPSPSPVTTPVSPPAPPTLPKLASDTVAPPEKGEKQSPVRQDSSPPVSNSTSSESGETVSGDGASSGSGEWAAPASAKESALGILADANKKAAASVYPHLPHAPSSPNKKLKAEFLPPSNAPPPNYVSLLEDGKSMCTICNKVFNKPSQLRLHVNIHYIERPFRCESCAISFRTKGHLQKHQRSVSHLNKVNMNSTFGTPTTSNPRPFKCDDCKIAFRIHGHLAKHLRSKLHIMKLECIGKLPFGTYADLERFGMNMNDIDTTDCDHSLDSLLMLAQKLSEKDPSKLSECPTVARSSSEAITNNLADAESSSGEDEDRPLSEKEDKRIPTPGLYEKHGNKLAIPSLIPVVLTPTLEDGGSNSSSSSSLDSGVGDSGGFPHKVKNLYPVPVPLIHMKFEPKLGSGTKAEDPVR